MINVEERSIELSCSRHQLNDPSAQNPSTGRPEELFEHFALYDTFCIILMNSLGL